MMLIRAVENLCRLKDAPRNKFRTVPWTFLVSIVLRCKSAQDVPLTNMRDS